MKAETSLQKIKHVVLDSLPDTIYAGITGSFFALNRATDIDIVAVVDDEFEPLLLHPERGISILAFDTSWLTYKKHEEKPFGIVPSILFKSIALSMPLIGSKGPLRLSPIRVCRADWMNLKIKKARFEGVDRKNHLVALVFEKLLEESPDLDKFSFDNIMMAKSLGLAQIAEELESIYSRRKDLIQELEVHTQERRAW